MPRRREVPKREILPDPKFRSQEVSKFVNVLMTSGKKAVAERIIYNAFDQVQGKSGKDPIEVFSAALDNLKPLVEVKSRRVGGANYQVPVEVRPSRRQALAMRWLRDAARGRGEKSMDIRLANEIMDASESKGKCDEKKRRSSPYGRSKQSILTFPFLINLEDILSGS
jgi:small subunit ribosomal protein S7